MEKKSRIRRKAKTKLPKFMTKHRGAGLERFGPEDFDFALDENKPVLEALSVELGAKRSLEIILTAIIRAHGDQLQTDADERPNEAKLKADVDKRLNEAMNALIPGRRRGPKDTDDLELLIAMARLRYTDLLEPSKNVRSTTKIAKLAAAQTIPGFPNRNDTSQESTLRRLQQKFDDRMEGPLLQLVQTQAPVAGDHSPICKKILELIGSIGVAVDMEAIPKIPS